jgi:YD repeat-containing protein
MTAVYSRQDRVLARAGCFLFRLRRLLSNALGRTALDTSNACDTAGRQKSAKSKRPAAPGDRDFEAMRQRGARSGIPRRSGNRTLLRSESSSAEGVHAATLYAYHPDGTPFLTALDLNTNGVIDLSGPDRVTGTSTAYEKDASNRWWQVSRSWVYPEPGSASAVTTSVQRTLFTNLGVPASTFPGVLCVPWLNGFHLVTSLSENIDIRGNATVSATLIDRAAKTVIRASLLPTSAQPEFQLTVNGLLTQTVSSTAVTNTYAYDGLARRTAATNGRGNTTVTAYNALGQVLYTENAAANRTTYGYDFLGRRIIVTDALGNTTHTAYDEDNRVIAQWGATYPVSYEYDTQGRMVQMGTYRGAAEITDYANFQSLVSSFDKTVWLYDQPTGLLTNKLYADGLGTAYTYTPDGKLATRLWARGITTTYAYTPISGELASIDYSDDTSDIAYTFNRLGQMLAANNTVSTNTFTYSPDTLELVSETQNGSVLARPTDAQGRPAGLALGEDYGVTYGYDDLGHFSSVSSSVLSVSSVDNYFRLPGTDIISGYTAGPLTVTKSFEPNRDLITSVSNHVNQVNPVLISAFDYANDAISRRVFRHDSGLAFEQSQTNAFGYNPRSEVTGAVMHTNAYGYVYDPIGNRLFSSHNAETNSYAANALNQYSQISAPPAPLRYPLYDADGNMTFDGKEWFYVWNGENRLVLAFNAQHVVTYAYDCRGRMVWKTVSQANASSDKQIKYVWDDYNIIAEHVITNGFENITYNVWGLDLSGTLQGAGGVGGLLSVHKDNDVYFPAYDANGNITEYISSSGTIAVHREYSAFGETTVLTGALPDLFTHWWSTKPWCIVTELSEYIYRKYKTDYGRWLSPDPLSEIFPREKYIFLGNSAIIHYDLFGLMSDEKCKQNADRFMSDAGKYSKTLKDVLDEINAISGCSPLSPECECCKEEKANWLGYTGEGNRVVLCSNNLDSGEGNITQNILETLVHEHIHVLQRCRNQDNQTCDGAVCTEIQAYLHDGTCHRKAPGNVKQCVIDGAAASAANRCENGQNEAKQRAEALYEKCNLPIKN